MDQKSIDTLVAASAAEAEAVSAAWLAAKEASSVSSDSDLSDRNGPLPDAEDKSQVMDASSDDGLAGPLQPDVRLHPRAV